MRRQLATLLRRIADRLYPDYDGIQLLNNPIISWQPTAEDFERSIRVMNEYFKKAQVK